MDVLVRDEGSIVLLQPENDAALAWFETNIGVYNSYQPYWPRMVVVEPRYVNEVLAGLLEEGFEVGV